MSVVVQLPIKRSFGWQIYEGRSHSICVSNV